MDQFSRVKSPIQDQYNQSELSSGQITPELDLNLDDLDHKLNAIRPDNLDLNDDVAPVRPPRLKKPSKRNEGDRLLSAPNTKQLRNDGQYMKDLRDKEDLITSPQPSFTGSFMRRFSKFLG